MAKRYTIKELNELSDLELANLVIRDRQDSVTNTYSPLNQRLEKLKRTFEKKCIWVVSFKGIPETAMFHLKDVEKYLQRKETSLKKVQEEMDKIATPEWEVTRIDIWR